MEQDTTMGRGDDQAVVLVPAAAIGFLMYGAAQQLVSSVPPANDRAQRAPA